MGQVGINKGMFHHILTQCHAGGSVLVELGSGETSAKFVEHGLTVYSIEHDEKWLGKYPGVNYIHAPLVPTYGKIHEYFTGPGNCSTYWYNRKFVEAGLPEHYDALLLDGPPRSYRPMFLYNWHCFRTDVPWFADDLSRPEWYRALLWLSRDRGLDTFPEVQGLQSEHMWCKIPAQGR